VKRALLSIVLVALLQTVPFAALGQDGTAFPEPKKLIVGVVHDPPYLIKNENGEWSGFSVDIWRAVESELKTPSEFKEMRFSEALNSLKDNTIDIAIDGFFLLAERARYMDFTIPIGSTRLALATLPGKVEHPWKAALKIFLSWGIMKIIGLLLLTLGALGLILWHIEREHNPEHFGGDLVKGIGSGVYWIGSTLASGVCTGVSLKSLTGRIMGLVWMLACAIILSALTASLTTSLFMSKNMSNTLDSEAIRRMHVAGIEGSAEVIVLKKINGKYTLYNTEEDALNAVLNQEVDGYLYDEITLQYYKDKDYKNKIAVYPTNLKRFSFAYGLPKNSPLRTRVNIALMDFMEKPDWQFLLSRYGIGQNFEKIESNPFRKN
jgi:ABC-type amino acid transport substrate-binding protein